MLRASAPAWELASAAVACSWRSGVKVRLHVSVAKTSLQKQQPEP